MKFFVLTDIEGVAGIDSFRYTRTGDEAQKAPAMDQLGREVNAAVRGIRSRHPDATVTVWDGHGSGGLRESDVADARYVREGRPYFEMEEYDALLFVGQHAMAGTYNAPLRHTYSSRTVDYFKLNGTFVGEFGCRALLAGLQGVPTIYLAGDDKATLEARQFVPEITTTAVKQGKGEEAAKHLPQSEACDIVEADAARAVDRLEEVPPLTDIEAPYTLEIRYYEPDQLSEDPDADDVTLVDDRTVRITGDEADLLDPETNLAARL